MKKAVFMLKLLQLPWHCQENIVTQAALALEGVHSDESIIQQLQRKESRKQTEELSIPDLLYTLSCL